MKAWEELRTLKVHHLSEEDHELVKIERKDSD